MSNIRFTPTYVSLGFDLLNPDGSACILPESIDQEIMALPFVDDMNSGFGVQPAEIVIYLKHPREVNPANLLYMQAAIASIIANHAAKSAEQEELPMGYGSGE